jgi:hypothetical protein
MNQDPLWLVLLRRARAYRAAIWVLRLTLALNVVFAVGLLSFMFRVSDRDPSLPARFMVIWCTGVAFGATVLAAKGLLSRAGADVNWWRRGLGLDRQTSRAVWSDVARRWGWREWDERHRDVVQSDPALEDPQAWVPLRWEALRGHGPSRR